MRGRSQGPQRHRPGGRSARRRAVLAVPVAGVTLALFAHAANNDLAALDAGGTTTVPTTTTTTIFSTAPTTATEAGGGPGNTAFGASDGAPGGAGGASGGLPPDPAGTGTTIAGGIDPDLLQPSESLDPDGESTAPGDDQEGAPTTTGAEAGPGAGPEATDGTTPTGDTGPVAGSGTSAPGGDSTGGDGGRGAANDSGGDIAGLLRTLVTAVVMAVSAAGMVYLALSLVRGIVESRRRRGTTDDDPTDDGDPGALVVVDPDAARWTLERLRERLESDPDPRSAIRHAYAAVETGFGAGGGLARRHNETPLQYLERSLGVIEDSAQPLRVLTGLFLLARYSNRPMTEAMRRTAITAVLDLQASYQRAEGLTV